MPLFMLPFLGTIELEIAPKYWHLKAPHVELPSCSQDTPLSTLYSFDLHLEVPLSSDEWKVLALLSSARPEFTAVEVSPFREAVWRAITTIPLGHTATYQELAQTIGNPRALQAVGTAVGANPFVWVVPCHRVVRADGRLGNFALGSTLKAALLLWERRVLALR
ncbi:methylated-DNA--[protein]-cysteine S-methyltransferase [Porphyromonas endodontalis]|uniref:methylated-DNA--[protein]-cysteine S-methyltransferase n=1 Tax=Porphyromonas endodontalis TaxID=28124 RepID=UPI003C7D08CB